LIGVLAQTLLPRIGGGRLAAYESLVVTPAVANLIRENKTFRINSAIQTGAKYGMMLMDDCLFQHWINEKIEMEEALGKAHDPDALAKRIATARREMEEGAMLDEDDLDEE
jgi:twitching motility protein PilT